MSADTKAPQTQDGPGKPREPRVGSDDTISGGHLVAKALRSEGVDTIFTLCGGHIIDIYDGCIDEGIKIVDVRHEQVAAHAADGHARITGVPGCAVVTAGPGTTDAITGVANAFRAESPFLLIGGQGALALHQMGSLQDLPHVDLLRPITKFASTVPTTGRIADFVAMAFRECFSGALGPSFLEIPRDVLDEKIPIDSARLPSPGRYRASTRSVPSDESIEECADLLATAERPAILLGTQVWMTRSVDGVQRFLRALETPVFVNGAARGILSRDHSRAFHLTRSYAFSHADVIMVVGTPFDFRMGYGRRLPDAAAVIQIDGDYRTVGKNRDVSIGLVGHPGQTLVALADALDDRAAVSSARATARGRWMKELRREEAKIAEMRQPLLQSNATPIHPLRLCHEIDNFLTEESIFIGDGGDIVTFSGGVVRPHQPGQWMDPGPLGTLGVGIPFAMAAKLARPAKEVVCLFGDGAFALTGWDFETMVRFGLPFIGIVGNNSAMNQIRYGQRQRYGPDRGDIGNILGDVPFHKFAEILGGYGEEVRDPNDIAPALRRARESDRPSLINVWVDRNIYSSGTQNQTMYK